MGDTATDENRNQSKGDKQTSEPVLQQPGEVIVPEVVDGIVEKIAEEVYGLTVTECRQLNGYDDKNYHIRVSPSTCNSHVLHASPEGYVMKIVNTMDTNRPDILYAQVEMMRHLSSHGISVQDSVPAKDGQLVTFYQFPSPRNPGESKKHAVCLRTFIPGQIVYDVKLTPDLCYKLGQFLGSMTKALEDFHHPFYDTFDYLWSMSNIPKLTEFVDVITDKKDRSVVEDVIRDFTTTVLPRRSEIRAGFIHGDPNEQNILVERKGGNADNPDYEVVGILDYQDAGKTHPLYDLALLVCYMMLQATGTFDPLDVGGHVLAGYVTRAELPGLERELLRTAVAGRLVQTLVLGAYNYSLDPTNQYVLTTATRGWRVLHVLWSTPLEVLYGRWESIENSYSKR